MTNFPNTTIPANLYPVANGTVSSLPFVDEFLPRDPTIYDINYPVQKKWLNTTDGHYWELEGFISAGGTVTAHWIKIASTQHVETLTGNSGGAVGPTLNNINVVGDGTYIKTVGNPATSTLTIEPAGGLTTLYTADVGTATPSLGNLNVFGGTGIHTNAAGNTITVSGKIAQAAASSSLTNAGVASFLNTQFSVDVNGFVSLLASVPSYVTVNHAASPYTVTATDHYIACLSATGTITILLPNAPTTLRTFIIKDRGGDASANNISITTVGGIVTIDGITTYKILSNYGSVNLLFNGTSYEVY